MFSINQRFLLLGQLLGITLYAYDELAVNTVMPIIAEQLNGDRFYGAAFAFYMIGAMVMVVWAGARLDRDGPRVPFATACILFALGLLLAAAASNMEVFVIARFLQGLGGGALYAVLFSLTAHGYDTKLRSKVIGLTSAAWILPAMVGPVSAALVHEYIGWRWIF
ncbi:MAG: MFS transporter, partial [Gammaproteobacteria bacterium]|nr:MFS transporter [Gammaproteobacteria bacterium]